jgi:phosphoribosyl 1,2-cyclic phosphodiesterase
VKVKLWGTRGTLAVPELAGSGGLGGNTPCVEVRIPGCELILLDGGTGLHWAGMALMDEGFGHGDGRAHVLLTHTHWGHIQGIPFFPPMLVPGNTVTVHGRGTPQRSLRDLLGLQMDAIYCPVPNAFASDLGADARVADIPTAPLHLQSARITAAAVNHAPGCTCLGYRIEADQGTLAYLPDVEYLEEGQRKPALALAQGADLLIHDAHFLAAEYEHQRSRGHCSAAAALQLAVDAGVRRLLFFHHRPGRLNGSDYAETASAAPSGMVVEPAREGAQYSIGVDGVELVEA